MSWSYWQGLEKHFTWCITISNLLSISIEIYYYSQSKVELNHQNLLGQLKHFSWNHLIIPTYLNWIVNFDGFWTSYIFVKDHHSDWHSMIDPLLSWTEILFTTTLSRCVYKRKSSVWGFTQIYMHEYSCFGYTCLSSCILFPLISFLTFVGWRFTALGCCFLRVFHSLIFCKFMKSLFFSLFSFVVHNSKFSQNMTSNCSSSVQ